MDDVAVAGAMVRRSHDKVGAVVVRIEIPPGAVLAQIGDPDGRNDGEFVSTNEVASNWKIKHRLPDLRLSRLAVSAAG